KAPVTDAVIDELREIIGDDERVLPNISSRVNRTRTPAPFPVHRWADFLPDVAVLPTTAEQVSGVIKLANRLRIPVVPRAGGTGLADGAVPLKGGIVVDVKLMNQIKEIDLADRTATVGTGINMLKLNEELRPHGVFYPDDPAAYPCSIVGARLGAARCALGRGNGGGRGAVRRVEAALPASRRRGVHRAARGRQGRGRAGTVWKADRGRAREQAHDGARTQRGWALPGGRDLRRRLGL